MIFRSLSQTPAIAAGLLAFATIAATVFNGAGFGSRGIEAIAAWSVLGAMAILGAASRNLPAAALAITVWLSSIVTPQILHLYGLWIVVFYALPKTRFLALATFLQWIFSAFPFDIKLLGSGSFLIATAIAWKLPVESIKRPICILGAILIAAIDVFNLFSLRGIDEFETYHQIEYPYQIGDLAFKLSGKSQTSGKVIRSSIHDTSIPDARAGVILLDHDQATKKPELASEQQFTQSVPWQWSSFIGDQYVLFWLKCDYFYISNKGGLVKPGGRILLKSGNPFKDEILISKRGSRIVFADSDCWVNRLSAYQINLNSFFLSDDFRGYLPAILSFGLLATLLIPKRMRAKAAIIAIACSTAAIIFVCPIEKTYGKLKLIGRISDPHDPAKFSGVLRATVDRGAADLLVTHPHDVTFIQEGRTFHASDESLIIAEPNSIIHFKNGSKAYISDVPQGEVNGVLDARKITFKEEKFNGVLRTPEATIIGTGSPSLIEVEKWLPH